VLTQGNVTIIRDGPAQVEATAADALPCTDGIRVNVAEPRLEEAFGGNASAPDSSRSPSSHLPKDDHDGGVIVIRLWGCGAPIQEGLTFGFLAGVLSIFTWCCQSVYTALASPIPVLTLKGWCWGDRSHTSSASIIRRPVTHP
jgi:hypothetical protein